VTETATPEVIPCPEEISLEFGSDGQIVFVSDVHLTGGGPVADFDATTELVELLTELGRHEGEKLLLFGGDIFDLLQAGGTPVESVDRVLAAEDAQAVAAASAALAAVPDATVVYVVGNHDSALAWHPEARGRVGEALICIGLVAVAASAAPEAADVPDTGTKVGIVAAVVVLAVLGWLALRHGQDTRSAIALATVSGLAYGGAALAARVLASGDGTYLSGDGLLHLLADSMLYALIAYGALGLATFSAALQRGTVTTVAAVVVVAETVAPALAGIALLGDRAKPALGVVAVLAFVATVVGAWVLTRVDPGRATAEPKSDSGGPTGPRPESRENA